MSLLRPLLNGWLKLVEKPYMARVQDPDELRRGFERKARLYFRMPRGVGRRDTELGGRPAIDLARKGSQDARCILYFHGGAYVFGNPRTHAAMLGWLCRAAQARAVLPDYRKAPEHPFPAGADDALAAWEDLLAQGVSPGDVVIGGDSAGGGLALGLLHTLLDRGLPLPAGVFALSPLTDLTFSGDSIRDNAQSEAVLPAARVNEMARMYLTDHPATDPRASPVFGTFTAAPPVYLTVSQSELLRDDTLRIAERLQAQGVGVQLDMQDDLPHVWPLFHTTLPEARASLTQLGVWIRQRTARTGES